MTATLLAMLPAIILFEPDTHVYALTAIMAALTLLAVLHWVYRLRHRCRRRWSSVLGTLLLAAGWYVLLYGSFVGITQLQVRHLVFESADLPEAFDGYRILQLSDAHLGSFNGWRRPLLDRFVDSINAQKADLIVFTGDIQNKVPHELKPFGRQLRRISAPDGVCSVLGNHDYSDYADVDEFERTANIGRVCSAQQELGWHLLNNGWHRIRRDSASIFIAGMENDGEGRFPQFGNISSALQGLSRRSFVVMLEHDPSSWRRKILPHSHCQLTLSGHTHGGQLSLFGLRPLLLGYPTPAGLYREGDRALYVTTGIGGVIPIRFGVSPEIVVITLKTRK